MSQKSFSDRLTKLKVPKVLMAGLLMASVLGWTGYKNLDKVKNYYEIKQIFPVKTTAVQVLDGDTFTIKNGLNVRLLGSDYLTKLILNKKLTFEYDKYQDDKFGRMLGYVFIDEVNLNIELVRNGLARVVLYEKRAKPALNPKWFMG